LRNMCPFEEGTCYVAAIRPAVAGWYFSEAFGKYLPAFYPEPGEWHVPNQFVSWELLPASEEHKKAGLGEWDMVVSGPRGRYVCRTFKNEEIDQLAEEWLEQQAA